MNPAARHLHPYDVDRRRYIAAQLRAKGPAQIERHLTECGGCHLCISNRIWRLRCRTCDWVGQWTNGAVLGASKAAVTAWENHEPL